MSAQQATPRDQFLEGIALSLPVLVGVAPFGALFGMLAVEHNFSVGEAMFMSAFIYAGASQLVGIELFGSHVAPWLIVLSIFAVNFRLVLYSAAVGRYLARWPIGKQIIGYFFLVDQLFAESERRTSSGVPLHFAWYMGMALTVYVTWLISTYLGAVFGQFIPDPHVFGIDFLLTIYFFCIVLTLRTRHNWFLIAASSALGAIVGYKTIGSPWHVTVGAFVGVIVGAFLPPIAAKDEAAEHDHTGERNP